MSPALRAESIAEAHAQFSKLRSGREVQSRSQPLRISAPSLPGGVAAVEAQPAP